MPCSSARSPTPSRGLTSRGAARSSCARKARISAPARASPGGGQAASSGLADRLTEDLRGNAHELAAEIASAAPLAVRAIRATMRDGLTDMARAAMARELTEQQKLWPTADFAEGVKAAAERRPANFSGQ